MVDLTAMPSFLLFGLGTFHGLNPGMGWLFAVALGMQEGRRAGVWRALGPLALGHALAIAAAVGAALLVGVVLPADTVRGVAGLSLVGFGVSRLLRQRHPRWGGMRVSAAGLTFWSFLMASAHGAGLMVVPIVLGSPGVHADTFAHHVHAASLPMNGALATLIHGLGYLAATAGLAVLVYEQAGLGALKRCWINIDVAWAAALVMTGALTVLL